MTGLLAPGWAGTDPLPDSAWVRAMLDVEAALARAQAKLGVIPAEAASAIARVAGEAELDLAGLVDGVHETANPVVWLVSQFTAAVSAVDPEAAEYVHRGGTSQDILDSAAMLICARVLRRVDADLVRTASALAGLVEAHLSTPMAGRTLTQHAVPTTFGLKAAGWLSLVLDARDRLAAVDPPVSLGGAGGTLSAYAEYGADPVALTEAFAAELGLAVPPIPWHALRTPIADIASALAFTSVALGKLAADVLVLTRTEIAEVAEPAVRGRGASSAMPQKRNPVLATAIATAARQVPPYALVLTQAVVAEDERPAGAWHAEWQPLRESLRLVAGAAANAAELTGGLTVDPAAMLANLRLTGGAVVSERLSARLAPILGKAAAKRLLTEVSQTSGDFESALRQAAGVQLDFDDLLDPARYLGAAPALARRVLARYRRMY
ncbi:3-carboxy-cis,cis-muconate cycloisomerase [Amycolatopsis xylanica]|uniref:3-carboxy-cis,cis-muconate cycloisomerase n=1 Tax=Amycolatopsis xylanica TaxID=589385 RepID=A0A1H2WA62_9PSEU|nr:adenylosuccinate lyase family protein [Amycolatopsis xylanica]SDW77480.1 3-carboxy-cis,cis-muconate cycloisomerase [Amycolatopsis xylanica]